MPAVVITDPQVASVGLTEAAALAIKQGLTFTKLGAMIFPYLTTVEGLKLATPTNGLSA